MYTKDTKKHIEKIRTTIHNTTNDQILLNKRILRPPAPSPTAQNRKSRYGKDTKLLKLEKKKSKKKQLMKLATHSVLVGRKAKVEPHQFCQ
jgi:predicted transcriptional regulator